MKIPSANDNKRIYRLTDDDAVQVHLRYWQGEFQHSIAAAYGVNQGRISDVINERTHIGSKHRAGKLWREGA